MRNAAFIFILIFECWTVNAGNETDYKDMPSDEELYRQYNQDYEKFMKTAPDQWKVRLNEILGNKLDQSFQIEIEQYRIQNAFDPHEKDRSESIKKAQKALLKERKKWFKDFAYGLSLACCMPCCCAWWAFGADES